MIYLHRATLEDGNNVYAYILVHGNKLDEFKRKVHDGNSINDLADCGALLEFGFGEPSDEVKAKMTNEFGFTHT